MLQPSLFLLLLLLYAQGELTCLENVHLMVKGGWRSNFHIQTRFHVAPHAPWRACMIFEED